MKVRLSEFVHEVNIDGRIIRGETDEHGPFIEIDASHLEHLRQQLRAGIKIQTMEGGHGHTIVQQVEEVE